MYSSLYIATYKCYKLSYFHRIRYILGEILLTWWFFWFRNWISCLNPEIAMCPLTLDLHVFNKFVECKLNHLEHHSCQTLVQAICIFGSIPCKDKLICILLSRCKSLEVFQPHHNLLWSITSRFTIPSIKSVLNSSVASTVQETESSYGSYTTQMRSQAIPAAK